MGAVCVTTKTNIAIKDKERVIKVNFTHDNNKYSLFCKSTTTVGEIKYEVSKKTKKQKRYLTLQYNDKDLKYEEIKLDFIATDKANEIDLLVTESEVTIREIKTLDTEACGLISIYCVVNGHDSLKCELFCTNCGISICKKCSKELHKEHNHLNKSDIVKFHHQIQNTNSATLANMKELKLDCEYNEFYRKFKHEIKENTDDLVNIVNTIKNKETSIINNFKRKFDSILPSIFDYREKLSDTLNLYEKNNENILRNDKDFMEYYQMYLQINSLTPKSNENLLFMKVKLNKYNEIVSDFKKRTKHMLDVLNEEYNMIKEYKINDENQFELLEYNNNMNNNNNNNINIAQFNSKNSNNNMNNQGEDINIGGHHSSNNLMNSLNKDNNTSNNNLNNYNSNNNPSININNFNTKINIQTLMQSPSKSISSVIKQRKKSTVKNDLLLSSYNKNSMSINTHNMLSYNLNNESHHNSNNNLNNNNDNNNNNKLDVINEFDTDDIKDISTIYNIETGSNNIYYFKKSENKILKKPVSFNDTNLKRFESYHSSINAKNKFYISGGSFNSKKDFYILDEEGSFSLRKLPKMLNGHSYHGMIGIGSFVFSISGFKSTKCEKFSIKNQTWENLPEVNNYRSWPSLLNHNNEFLFIFAGLSEDTELNTIERLNLKENKQWSEIKIKLENDLSISKLHIYSGFIYKRANDDDIEQSKLYILGGKVSKEEEPNDKVFSLDLESFELKEDSLKLSKSDEFDGRGFIRFNIDSDDDWFYGGFSSTISRRFHCINLKDESKSKIYEYEEQQV